MKITKPKEFNLPAFTGKERDHIRARANEILGRNKADVVMRGKIEVLQNGNTCAPSIWRKKRFTKTV